MAKRKRKADDGAAAAAGTGPAERTADDAELCKFVKFEQQIIHREQIKGAPYNPRTIGEKERKKLRANLEGAGLLNSLVWNRRSGNLVSGHQRISILDSLMRTKNYRLPVDVVDLDEKTEKEQNVFFNNQSGQGDFDIEKLSALFQGPDKVDHEKAGLDVGDMYHLFGENAVHDDAEAMIELAERVRKAKELQKEIKEKRATRDADHFFLCFVFKDREHLLAVLERAGLPANCFADGRFFEELLAGASAAGAGADAGDGQEDGDVGRDGPQAELAATDNRPVEPPDVAE